MTDAVDTTDFARIFALQGRHQPAVRATSAAQRIAKLQAQRAAVVSHLPAVREALADDFGKPGFEAASEAMAVLGEIDTIVAQLEEWMKPVEVTPSATAAPGARARIIRGPKGQVLIFGPWNFPFALLLQPLLGAGCRCCGGLRPELAAADQRLRMGPRNLRSDARSGRSQRREHR
jgi:aldehyde dehydrogenase (NAD+)